MGNTQSPTRSLPVELWLEILPLAVYVPGLLATKWDTSVDEMLWEGQHGHARMVSMSEVSYHTRRSIVLVCRDWWMMGRPFVYESLAFGERASVAALVALFEGDYSVVSNPGNSEILRARPSGSWLKRIDIKSNIWFEPDNFTHLKRLLMQCINVHVLVLSEACNPSQMSQLLHSPFLHSLHRISVNWTPRPWNPTSNRLDQPFRLRWAALTQDSLRTHSPLLHIPLSHLSVLEIFARDGAARLPALVLPMLRYVSLCQLKDAHISSLLPFAVANGPRLLGLSLYTMELCPSIYKLLQPLTMLKSLVMDEVDFETFIPPHSSSFPSITHIGIANSHPSAHPDIYRVHQGLTHILPRGFFPNLQIIRILIDNTSSITRRKWAQCTEIALGYGVRLEDRNLHLFRVRRKDSSVD